MARRPIWFTPRPPTSGKNPPTTLQPFTWQGWALTALMIVGMSAAFGVAALLDYAGYSNGVAIAGMLAVWSVVMAAFLITTWCYSDDATWNPER